MSKVLTKIVLVDGDSLCYCDEDFYKTCMVRLSKDLKCKECLIRITEINRNDDVEGGSLSDMLDAPSKEFLKTLNHLGRVK